MSELEIRDTKNKGKGLYSKVHFDVGQTILKLNGRILNTEQIKHLTYDEISVLLQIGIDKYLDLKNDQSYYLNHSCNFNTSIKIFSQTAFLATTRVIKPGEELLFDYSTTSTDTPETWQMACKCGEWNCRGLISGFNTLTDKEKERYIKMGILPKYIR